MPFLLPDREKCHDLARKFGWEVAHEPQTLVGYRLFVVEEWLLIPDTLKATVVESTGEMDDKVTFTVVRPTGDVKKVKEILAEPRTECSFFEKTKHGYVYLANIKTLQSLTLLHLPSGNFEQHRESLLLQLTLKRLGCPVGALSLSRPFSELDAMFSETFPSDHSIPLQTHCELLVEKIQSGLKGIGLLPTSYELSGIYDDSVEDAIRRLKIQLHGNADDGNLDPSMLPHLNIDVREKLMSEEFFGWPFYDERMEVHESTRNTAELENSRTSLSRGLENDRSEQHIIAQLPSWLSNLLASSMQTLCEALSTGQPNSLLQSPDVSFVVFDELKVIAWESAFGTLIKSKQITLEGYQLHVIIEWIGQLEHCCVFPQSSGNPADTVKGRVVTLKGGAPSSVRNSFISLCSPPVPFLSETQIPEGAMPWLSNVLSSISASLEYQIVPLSAIASSRLCSTSATPSIVSTAYLMFCLNFLGCFGTPLPSNISAPSRPIDIAISELPTLFSSLQHLRDKPPLTWVSAIISQIQGCLINLFYLPEAALTGILDMKTVEAVKSFQNDHAGNSRIEPKVQTEDRIYMSPGTWSEICFQINSLQESIFSLGSMFEGNPVVHHRQFWKAMKKAKDIGNDAVLNEVVSVKGEKKLCEDNEPEQEELESAPSVNHELLAELEAQIQKQNERYKNLADSYTKLQEKYKGLKNECMYAVEKAELAQLRLKALEENYAVLGSDVASLLGQIASKHSVITCVTAILSEWWSRLFRSKSE